MSKMQRNTSVSKEQTNDYFVQGFDLPQNEEMLRNKLLATIPILKTKAYRESLLTIVSSFSQLQRFSNNLQGKVDCLLQAQQTQFVQSYKGHIRNIKQQFEKMNGQIQQLRQKIRYYENEGEMSKLVRKVFNLQFQSTGLYKKLNEKDKKIKDLELLLKLKQDQIYSLHERFKNNVREKTQTLNKDQHSRTLHSEGKNLKSQELLVFTTEVKKKHSGNHANYFHQDSSPLYHLHPSSSKSITVEIQGIKQNHSFQLSKKVSVEQRLNRQNNRLKMRNRKLLSFQTKVVQHQNDLQQFFINCVEELKKQIMIRKKINYCSLQQFKKEDKLMLMIKVLSNNEILAYLHERLFRKKATNTKSQQTQTVEPNHSAHLHQKLPKINFNLNYQAK